MSKNNDKGYFLIDPFEDKVMDRIFNDLLEYPVVEYNPDVHGGSWWSVSKKIGIRCKDLIDNKNGTYFITIPVQTLENKNILVAGVF